jgi:hypothetical protein
MTGELSSQADEGVRTYVSWRDILSLEDIGKVPAGLAE